MAERIPEIGQAIRTLAMTAPQRQAALYPTGPAIDDSLAQLTGMHIFRSCFAAAFTAVPFEATGVCSILRLIQRSSMDVSFRKSCVVAYR